MQVQSDLWSTARNDCHFSGRQGVSGSNPLCSTRILNSEARRAAGLLMPTAGGGTQKGTQSAAEYPHVSTRQTAAQPNGRLCPEGSAETASRAASSAIIAEVGRHLLDELAQLSQVISATPATK